MNELNMMSLNYDICPCCGRVIPIEFRVCSSCESNQDSGFRMKKKRTLERLYGYDIAEWNDVDVSPGYTEIEGREALKELLREIKDRADASQKEQVV